MKPTQKYNLLELIRSKFARNKAKPLDPIQYTKIQLRRPTQFTYSSLTAIGHEPSEAGKPCIVTPDMVLRPVCKDKAFYYLQVYCNYETLFCDKQMQEAKHGKIVMCTINEFDNLKIRR